MAKGSCIVCGKKLGMFDSGDLCYDCQTQKMKVEGKAKQKEKEAEEFFEKKEEEKRIVEMRNEILMSTTPTLEGYSIKDYLGIEIAEVVMGTSFGAGLVAGLADFFGTRSEGYENSLSEAKDEAFDILRFKCKKRGGNALIGVGFEYITTSNDMLGIIVNGTVVKIEKN